VSDDELRPHVVPPRRQLVVVAFAIPLATVLLWPHRAEPPSHATFAPQLTVNVSSAAPIVLPPPVPAAANRPSCPPQRRDAPFVKPVLPDQIDYVQPAPSNAGWIAAWNDANVYVSYDAGATFSRALDGDGKVLDASFDCWGHLIVLRGHRVGVRDGIEERWHDVPGLRNEDHDPAGVLGGGPDIVIVGTGDDFNARVARSSDGAATWSYIDLHGQVDSGSRLDGRQLADGTIEAGTITGDCMDDDLTWSTIRGTDVTYTPWGLGEGEGFAIYGDVLVATNRWARREGPWNELALGHDDVARPVPGAFPVLVTSDHAFRLVDGKLVPLPVVVEGAPQAVDLAGRIWSVACGELLVAQRKATGVPAKCESGD